MLSIFEIISLILVGATWGCSNSFLRKGSTDTAVLLTNETSETIRTTTASTTEHEVEPQLRRKKRTTTFTWLEFLRVQLSKFRHVSVWLPYVVNQSGSLLYYITLSQTDISIAVPACNALSLVFTICTSWFVLREPVERPFLTMIGAALIMGGVSICIQAADKTK